MRQPPDLNRCDLRTLASVAALVLAACSPTRPAEDAAADAPAADAASMMDVGADDAREASTSPLSDVLSEGRTADVGCVPGVGRCTAAGAREVCAADGSGYIPSPCPLGQTCSMGECILRVCDAGMTRCMGPTSVQTCSADGSRFDPPVDCAFGSGCDARVGMCVPWRCTPGTATSCASVTERAVCNADGQGTTAAECAMGESCTAGACRPRGCTPGARRCAMGSSGTVETCAADGLSWVASACGARESCTGAGVCAPWVCTPGTATCPTLATRSVCNADGQGSTVTSCPAMNACVGAGACTPWVCTPGTATSCANTTTRRVCNVDGQGTSDAACAAGESCAAGSCLRTACVSMRYGGPIPVGSGSEVQGWFAADFDNDRVLDVLMVDQLASRASLVRGLGSGMFAPPAHVATGRNHGDAAIADFDGDGRIDVVLSQPDGSTIERLRGQGTSLLSLGRVSQGSTPRAMTAIDFDHDGDMDLAVYLAGVPCLAIRLNDGVFNFGPPTCAISTPGVYSFGMTTIDWDRDGRADIVESGSVAGQVIVHRSTPGRLTEIARIATGAGFFHTHAVDLDRDGSRDLAVYGGVAPTLSGRGYAVGRTTPICSDLLPPSGVSLVSPTFLGDFNNDGELDWLTRADPAVGPVRVHLALPAAPPRSCAAILAAAPGSPSRVYTIDPDGAGPTAAFNAYCDMTASGGGWTLVAAQFESNPETDWNRGTTGTYDPTLATGRSFALSTSQLPPHTQTGFGRGLDATFVDYANYVYTTGNLALTTLSGLRLPRSYQIHRSNTSFYSFHDPEHPTGLLSPCSVWCSTLTFDQTGGSLYSWAFSPNHTDPWSRGCNMLGLFGSTAETYAWTVWVR